jgi:hypothetical protein
MGPDTGVWVAIAVGLAISVVLLWIGLRGLRRWIIDIGREIRKGEDDSKED